MELFDTHCHLHELTEKLSPVYDKWHSDGVERTAEDVITAAKEVGVNRLICVGTTLADSQLAIKFASARKNVWASIGIHPHEAATALQKDHLDAFAALLTGTIPEPVQETDANHPKNHLRVTPFTGEKDVNIVAIGECGLDYFYNYSPKEAQIEVLKFQLELAFKHSLPMSFHVRAAFDDFWPIFEPYNGKIRGVLHSFTDSEVNLRKALNYGLYIGVNGIATFAKSPERSVIYRTIPQQSLLLETDAPFLTPVPFRGKVCESKYVRVTAEYLSDLRGESLEQLAAATTKNALNLFNI
ncbi:MAG: TatD family hydrolase [Candidatus Saccharimonadales bacterium]